MIIIIRALSQWGKDDGDYDSPTSRDETPDEKQIGQKKEKRPKQKNERKRDKGQCYYAFTTLVLQSSTMIFMIESLLYCHFHILVGIFHYRTWLVYSNNGLHYIKSLEWWEHFVWRKSSIAELHDFCRDELSLAMLFWEDMIALISMLKVLLFLC